MSPASGGMRAESPRLEPSDTNIWWAGKELRTGAGFGIGFLSTLAQKGLPSAETCANVWFSGFGTFQSGQEPPNCWTSNFGTFQSGQEPPNCWTSNFGTFQSGQEPPNCWTSNNPFCWHPVEESHFRRLATDRTQAESLGSSDIGCPLSCYRLFGLGVSKHQAPLVNSRVGAHVGKKEM